MKIRFFPTFGVVLMLAAELCGAEHFGSISVTPQTIASGETYHGYREYRILLENDSLKDSHEVTLIFPDRSYNYGNSIGQISRTVVLAPSSRAVVPLWQPPLPQNGSSLLRVIVDGAEFSERVGISSVSHMNRSGVMSGGGIIPATILVSRSLNYDDLGRALHVESHGFSAAMAVGAPDSGRRRGMTPTAWSPDSSHSGPHWIELDYATPIKADRLRLYETQGLFSKTEVVLTGTSGTNYPPIAIPSGGAGTGSSHEVIFPFATEPIKTVRIDFGTAYAGTISVDAVELIGPGGNAWASDARTSSEMSGGSTPGREMIQLLRAESQVGDWSETWLSYSCFDGIAITAADLRTMPSAVQNALWRYTEAGGNLLVLGSDAIPEPWRSLQKTAISGGQSVRPGFGNCFALKAEKIPQLSPEGIDTITTTLTESARKWQSLPDDNSANSAFRVVENVRIPVRGIVVIMLAFVITIGPVNIIYLSRKNRRTWLLWTIPAISFVTSGIVFIYSLLHEGITPSVRTESITFLDQASHRAATFGMEAFYCPLTPGGGLYFSSDTEATPLVEAWNYRRGTDREVDWTQGQHLQRGWVNARVPSHFVLRKTDTCRERIQLEPGTQPGIVNGLGTSIRSLWLADSSGKIYSASNVAAGQKAPLIPTSLKISSQSGPQALLGGSSFGSIEGFISANVPSYLQRGSYIAELDGNPFLENGLRSKSANVKARSLVYGILETTSQP